MDEKIKIYLSKIDSQLNILLQNFKHIQYSVYQLRACCDGNSVYNKKLKELDGIPRRFFNVAMSNGIYTVSDLLKISAVEFSKFRWVSIKTVYTVREILKNKYLIFWD